MPSYGRLWSSSDRYVAVLALDDSLGGDGIVAHKDIRSIADLKGKMVGVDASGTVSQFYLNVLLKEAGLSQDDIEIVTLAAEDAGNAFLMREVDAAVTWEPWLTQGQGGRARPSPRRHSGPPGLMVDVPDVEPSVLEDRLPEFRALARAWDAAVDYVEAHPEEANGSWPRNVGGWLEDPAVFAETLKGVRFYDAEREPGVFRHAGPPRPDLRPRRRHRRLVEPRRARGRPHAGRRDRHDLWDE